LRSVRGHSTRRCSRPFASVISAPRRRLRECFATVVAAGSTNDLMVGAEGLEPSGLLLVRATESVHGVLRITSGLLTIGVSSIVLALCRVMSARS
jgi:hypothetical protein